MATHRTVSEEMAWTDWSLPEERAARKEGKSTSTLGVVTALLLAVAALAGIVFLLPPGSY